MTWSKTSQGRNKEVVLPLLEIKRSILCPVKALDKMFERHRGKEEGPAFLDKNSNAMSYRKFREFIKRGIRRSGLNPACYSTHSLRRGGATWAFKLGVPESVIKNMGNWRSDCYQKYLSYDLECKTKMCQLVSTNLKNNPLFRYRDNRDQ
jgi:integrase